MPIIKPQHWGNQLARRNNPRRYGGSHDPSFSTSRVISTLPELTGSNVEQHTRINTTEALAASVAIEQLIVAEDASMEVPRG